MSCDPGKAGRSLKRKREKPLVEKIPAEQKDLKGTGESKFARALGSTDFQTRDKGLNALTRWLATRSSVPELDLLKLWKGIFFCFWHSDKAPYQAELAEKLAEIQSHLKAEVAFAYFAAFLKTIRREWLGIDRLRLDKFMMLIRRFLRHMFVLLGKSNWDIEAVRRYTQHLVDGCLCPSDTYPAIGVAYHIADIYVEELELVAADGSGRGPPRGEEPFRQASCRSTSQALLRRMRDGVFFTVAERVEGCEGPISEIDCEALAERIFGDAASKEVSQKNRNVLYEISNRLAKAAARAAERRGEAAAGEADRPTPSGRKEESKEEGDAKPKKAKKKSKAEAAKEEAELDSGEPRGTPNGKGGAERVSHGGENGVASGEGNHRKKRRKAEPGSSPEAVAADPVLLASAGNTPGPGKPLKARKRSSDGVAGIAPLGAALSSEPATPQGTQPPAPATEKKSVRFSIQHNLYFEASKPPPPADIRTPPSARPRGPALKRSSLSRASKTPQPGGSKKAATPVTPRSAPRPSAIDFF
uniref:Ribosomal RNA-processing protein 1 n=1 Tax=Tetraselmis sp. GSL018 TaxID=582737 RepID=A0A061SC00_9CHLO